MSLFADRIEANQRVVLLGRAVKDAFGYWNDRVGKLDYFRWVRTSGVWWAYSPHPSGLSRTWNDLDVRVGGSTFWRAVVSL